jgi:hypothetical protein
MNADGFHANGVRNTITVGHTLTTMQHSLQQLHAPLEN